ncbi:MAG: Sec-independent protein translocase protein TatB [Pseudomonadota bacterium]
MFDIGLAEMVVIGVVALIVVGPKDLPMMFRRVGQFVGRMRAMARDFQSAMDQAADESGLKEAGDAMRMATSMKNLGLDDAAKSLATATAQYEARKVDAAAEHAARQKAVEEANKAAEQWPPEGVEAAATEVAKDAEPAPSTAEKATGAQTLATATPAAADPASTPVEKLAGTKAAAPTAGDKA